MLGTLEQEVAKLPAEEQPAFAEVISEKVGLLRKIVETAMALPGVKELLGPVVTPMLDTLSKLGG